MSRYESEDADYDAWLEGLSTNYVKERFRALGVEYVAVKRLAPNNNSKNQIFLQGKINEVELPMGEFWSEMGTSKKTGQQEVIYHAPLDLAWLTPTGVSPAPRANLVHYPQYPETRLSGFLDRAKVAPRSLLSHRPGRVFSPERLLLLGVAGNGFGFGLVGPDDTARTLSARYYKDGSEILVSRGGAQTPRRLTPRECARLMGFPDTFRIPVSDTQAYKQFGNSIVVPVVSEIAAMIASQLRSQIGRESVGAA